MGLSRCKRVALKNLFYSLRAQSDDFGGFVPATVIDSESAGIHPNKFRAGACNRRLGSRSNSYPGNSGRPWSIHPSVSMSAILLSVLVRSSNRRERIARQIIRRRAPSSDRLVASIPRRGCSASLSWFWQLSWSRHIGLSIAAMEEGARKCGGAPPPPVLAQPRRRFASSCWFWSCAAAIFGSRTEPCSARVQTNLIGI